MTDDLTETLREIVTRLDALGIQYMLVGSVAALAHGRSRTTQDFDIVIDPNPSAIKKLVNTLPENRFYASEDAALEAIRHQSQFNVIDLETGWKVDLIPRKARPFSMAEFARRAPLDVLGQRLFVATIEDTIVAKLEWAQAGGGSERQLEDVRELLRLGGEQLERPYIERWVRELDLYETWQSVTTAST